MEALHASLRTETEVLRSDVARERQRLREERQEFESQKRELIHRSQQSREEAEVRLPVKLGGWGWTCRGWVGIDMQGWVGGWTCRGWVGGWTCRGWVGMDMQGVGGCEALECGGGWVDGWVGVVVFLCSHGGNGVPGCCTCSLNVQTPSLSGRSWNGCVPP